MSSWIPTLFNPNPESFSSTPKVPESPSSGVKEDLSAVVRGVASFLAPPPTLGSSSSSSSDAIAGIKNDLAEIRGSLKSGLSLLTSKFSSNFSHLRLLNNDDYGLEEEEEEEEYDDAVGITEEVLDFVRKLCKRPELWNDFPLSLTDDFYLSDHQKEHTTNIDYLVPELMRLRQKIGSQISYGKFWMIYFILLLPRFNEADFKLLSTPEVVNARETLLMRLQTKSNTVQDTSKTPETSELKEDSGKDYIPEGNESALGHKHAPSEIVCSGCSAGNVNSMRSKDNISEEDDSVGLLDAQKQPENEDLSFSDLEDEDNDLSEKTPEVRTSNSSRGETSEWIKLHENSGSRDCPGTTNQSIFRDKESEGEGEDSVEWLAIDYKDFDNFDAD